MPSIGDIISIAPKGRFLAQINLNVYWYQVLVWGGAATIANAIGQFGLQVGTPQRAIQTNALLFFELEWKNWSNPAELVRSPYDVTGTINAETMAPVNAGKFRLFGFSAATRSGWKRPGAIAETAVNSGVVQAAAFAAWDAYRDGIKAILEPAPSSTIFRLQPVIVGTAVDGSKDLARVNPVANVEYDLNTTSQTSRKVGRGS